MSEDQGRAVVYVASSRKFVEEAAASAGSIRRWMPDITIHLQVASGVDVTPIERAVFTMIHIYDNPQGYIDKANFLNGLNEKNVLFLDGDTFVVDVLWDGFDILNRFELAAAHAPGRIMADLSGYQIPPSFPEFNTGVIFCRNTDAMRNLFAQWRSLHNLLTREMITPHDHDQAAFRLAVWQSHLSVGTLTPEYNARVVFPTFLSGRAKIFHLRHSRIAAIAETVNSNLSMRVFRPTELEVLGETNPRPLRQRARALLARTGRLIRTG